MPTIPEIIDIAKLSQALANFDNGRSGLFGQRPDALLPMKLYMERKAVEGNYDLEAALVNKSGIAVITVNTIGGVDNTIEVSYVDPLLGLINFGIYTITALDTTTYLLATNIAAELSLNIYGYVFTAVNNKIAVIAPSNLGDTVNGTELIITITTGNIFDFTFDSTFN